MSSNAFTWPHERDAPVWLSLGDRPAMAAIYLGPITRDLGEVRVEADTPGVTRVVRHHSLVAREEVNP